MKISLESGTFGWDYIIEAEDGRTVLIQTDWDYPAVARTFGWDGEVGKVKNERDMISKEIIKAQQYLDDNIGKVVDDPGYFD